MDVFATGCRSHLILMMANYPFRWDPVPAGCHGDITRASFSAGAAAGNHPDPELTGKDIPQMMLRPARVPSLSPTTHRLNLFLLKGPLAISGKPPGHLFIVAVRTHTPAGRHNGSCYFLLFMPSCYPVRFMCVSESHVRTHTSNQLNLGIKYY